MHQLRQLIRIRTSKSKIRAPSFSCVALFKHSTFDNMTDVDNENKSKEMSAPKWQDKDPYKLSKDFKIKHSGRCDCGRVEIHCQTDPLDVKICHCYGCQKLHGAPMQIAAIFHKKDIQFTKDSLQHLSFYNNELKKNEHILPCKLSCSYCHSLIADEGRNMFLLFPTILDFKSNTNDGRFPKQFEYNHHIFYKSRCVDIDDNFPKYDTFRPSKH